MHNSRRKKILIVTPAPVGTVNGNRHSAERWAEFLADRHETIVQPCWNGAPPDLLIALHARRSHESIAAIRSNHPEIPIAVILTGTDLYHDLPSDPAALESLQIADAIVVLQDDAWRHVPERHAAKVQVIFQSARPVPSSPKDDNVFECTVVGNLRPEKDPLRVIAALGHIASDVALRVHHIGAPLDAEIAQELRRRAQFEPRYHLSAALPHGAAREAIARSHLLILPSLMEGGANVIAEALMSGTPVIASRVSGNIGMLGRDYPGFFDVGDSEDLARLLLRCLDSDFYTGLTAAAAARAHLFVPAREAREVNRLVDCLLESRRSGSPQRT